MKNKLCICFVSLFSIICFSEIGYSQIKASTLTVSPMVGFYSFEGNQPIESAPVVGLGLGYNFTDHLGAELMLKYGKFKFFYCDPFKALSTCGSSCSDDTLDGYFGQGDLIYNLTPKEKFVPYVAAGLGYYMLDDDRIKDNSSPFFNYGIGFNYFINKKLSIRGDIRHILTHDEFNNNMSALVGVSLFFGKAKRALQANDSDRDGVADKYDQCSNTPDGIEVDDRGCSLDSDKDGVPDYLDRCADTLKGIQVDASGCPPDADVDEVPDYIDKCPHTPFGIKVDQFGCPFQNDKDGDGIIDDMDKCPDTPKGAAVDDKGCPKDSDKDSVPDYIDQCQGTPLGAEVNLKGCWSIQNLNFDTAKWDIKPKYNKELDKVVKILKDNLALKIQIEGHTDNKGKKAANQKLSEKRAISVMSYFLKQGIASNRMFAVGLGQVQPIAPNKTEKGRAENRRIELKPIIIK